MQGCGVVTGHIHSESGIRTLFKRGGGPSCMLCLIWWLDMGVSAPSFWGSLRVIRWINTLACLATEHFLSNGGAGKQGRWEGRGCCFVLGCDIVRNESALGIRPVSFCVYCSGSGEK